MAEFSSCYHLNCWLSTGNVLVNVEYASTLFTLSTDKIIWILPSDSYIILKLYDHSFLAHRTRYGNIWRYDIEVAAQRRFQRDPRFSFAPNWSLVTEWVGRIGTFV
jgi:hypothetical protein